MYIVIIERTFKVYILIIGSMPQMSLFYDNFLKVLTSTILFFKQIQINNLLLNLEKKRNNPH